MALIQSRGGTVQTFSSRAAVQTSSDAMQIHGAYSYSKDYVVERLYRDAKITEDL